MTAEAAAVWPALAVGGIAFDERGRVLLVQRGTPPSLGDWTVPGGRARTYGDQISYDLVMGGMIPSWPNYNDPLNAIASPAQMGPLWMYAAEITQSKMYSSIWIDDPPASSFPPSIAVKTAGLQSAVAAENYLFNIRRAMMEEGVNISKEDVLLSIAREITGLDFDQFVEDWSAGNGKEPFRADLRKTRFHGIGRFPTITFHTHRGNGIMLVGYRPYKSLKEAFEYMRKMDTSKQPSLQQPREIQ